jgi:hypothetical protein
MMKKIAQKVLLVIVIAMLCNNAWAGTNRWVRTETSYLVQPMTTDKIGETKKELVFEDSLGIFKKEPLNEVMTLTTFNDTGIKKLENLSPTGLRVEKIVERIVPKSMTERERWYVSEEIRAINKKKLLKDDSFPYGIKITVPKYRLYTSGRTVCSDMRNIMVAVIKGRKYGVHWAYMIGVRTQENPSPRRDHFAYGVMCKKGTNLWTQAEWGAKILKRCTRNASHPSYSDMDRASHTYVGYETSEWPQNVYGVFKRCQGLAK